MLNEMHDKHFKSSKAKTDFSRKFKKEEKVDDEILNQLRKIAIENKKREVLKSILILVFVLTLVGLAIYIIAN